MAKDIKGSRRTITVSFYASEKESKNINRLVKASGLTKQDYIISRLEQRDVVVVASPRVYVGLKQVLSEVVELLKDAADRKEEPDIFLLDTIRFATEIAGRLQRDSSEDKFDV